MNLTSRCCLAAAVIVSLHVSLPVMGSETGATIEEVVVTARKKEESIQDVPMTISALSGGFMEDSGYTEMNDVERVVTNLIFDGLDRTKPLIFVRGIGSRTYDPGSDPSVGVFIDGVYLGRFGGMDMDLNDLERMEVLKGPQGTLYGRNTIGGAISVVTKDPTEEFEGSVSVEAGSSETSGDDLWSVSAGVKGPLGDSGLLGSLSVNHRERDGYIRVKNFNARGGNEDSTSFRAKLIVPIGDTASLKLAADYTEADGPVLVFTRNDLNGRSPSVVGIPVPEPTDLYEATASRGDLFTDKEIRGISSTLDWSWGEWDFTSITSYRELDWIATDDLDASELEVSFLTEDEESEQFSQELRMNFSTDNADVLIGLFYGKEEVARHDYLDFGPDGLELFVPGVDLLWDFGEELDSRSIALFGQVEWAVSERWSVTLGGRYSKDEKDFDYDVVTNNIFATSYVLGLSEDWDSFDPSISARFEYSDDIMFYASYASGYKSGAFQFFPSSVLAAQKVADPEEVDSYEVGMKSTLLDKRLKLNASVFQMDYQDLQLLSLSPLGVGSVSAVLVSNAANSTIRGLELETQALLSDQWSLDFSYGYLDGEFDDYVRSPTQDFSGNKLARSPEHTVNLALNYTQEYAFGAVDARIGYSWRDEYFFEPDNNLIDPESVQDSGGLLDASVKISMRDGWSVLIWGRNLGNKEMLSSVLNSENNPQRIGGIEPRTVGLKLTKMFGAAAW